MFVPAMPAVARDLHSSESTIQLAVTLYLVGLGLGQLLAGPISDRIGRRPVLLAGMVLFVVGSGVAATVHTAEALIGARLMQALGGAACLVAARTMVSDLTVPSRIAARMATLATVVLLSPAISPVIGGLISAGAGWRAVFYLLTGLGVALLAVGSLVIKESRSRTREGAEDLLACYSRLFGNERFLRFAVAIAGTSCALYIFLASSSFLLSNHYGLGPQISGACYFLVAAASVAGTLAVGHLERGRGAMRLGIAAIAAGGILMTILAIAGFDNVVGLMTPMVLVGFGAGVTFPAGITGAMHAEEGLSGTASSLAGALQMVVSGITTSLVAYLGHPSLLLIALGILVASVVALSAAPKGRAILRSDGGSAPARNSEHSP